jgi:hypothetical protein
MCTHITGLLHRLCPIGFVQFQGRIIKAVPLRQQAFHRAGKVVHLNLRRPRQLSLCMSPDESVPKVRATVLEARSRGEALGEEDGGERGSAAFGIPGLVVSCEARRRFAGIANTAEWHLLDHEAGDDLLISAHLKSGLLSE